MDKDNALIDGNEKLFRQTRKYEGLGKLLAENPVGFGGLPENFVPLLDPKLSEIQKPAKPLAGPVYY